MIKLLKRFHCEAFLMPFSSCWNRVLLCSAGIYRYMQSHAHTRTHTCGQTHRPGLQRQGLADNWFPRPSHCGFAPPLSLIVSFISHISSILILMPSLSCIHPSYCQLSLSLSLSLFICISFWCEPFSVSFGS